MKRVAIIIITDKFDIERLRFLKSKSKTYNYIVEFNIILYSDDHYSTDECNLIIKRPSEVSDIKSHIRSIIKNDIYCFSTINNKVDPVDGFIDQFDLDTFDDQNYGAIYCDFSMPNIDTVFQKSMPIKNNLLPLVFFNPNHYSDAKDPESVILSNSLCKHLPRTLCKLNK